MATCANTTNLNDRTDLEVGIVHVNARTKKVSQRAYKHAYNHLTPDCQ